MSALLRGELLKLRTTRTFLTLVGAAMALSLLVVVLTGLLVKNFDHHDVRDLFTGDFTGLFILLLGVMGMAGEWRHRTITSSVLAAPDRLRLLAAKLISYVVAGAVLSLVVTLSIIVVGSVILSARSQPGADISTLLDILWRNLVTAAYFGALGVCLGALLRNQVVAIVGVLIFSFAVEPTLFGLVPSVGKFSPIGGAPSGLVGTDFNGNSSDLLAPGIAALVMVGWLAVLFAGAAALLRGRDLT
jgi:ABC-2 type transport system permease protein